MNRRAFLAAAASVGLLLPYHSALAAGPTPYQADAFAKALQAGPVVVHVHADWCPVCRKQQSALQQLSQDPGMAKVQFIIVNFDKDRAFLRRNKVTNQSVIVIFKGGEEVARLIGTTDAEKINAGIAKALG